MRLSNKSKSKPRLAHQWVENMTKRQAMRFLKRGLKHGGTRFVGRPMNRASVARVSTLIKKVAQAKQRSAHSRLHFGEKTKKEGLTKILVYNTCEVARVASHVVVKPGNPATEGIGEEMKRTEKSYEWNSHYYT